MGQDRLQADSGSEQSGLQFQREDGAAESAEQDSWAVHLWRMQGMAGKRASLDTWDVTCGLSANLTSETLSHRD